LENEGCPVLSSIFKYAEKWGYVKKNPVKGISIDATPNIVERFLDQEELNDLLKSSKESSWNKLHLLSSLVYRS